MGQSQGSHRLWAFSHLSSHYPGQTLAPTLTTNFGESLSRQRQMGGCHISGPVGMMLGEGRCAQCFHFSLL